MKRKFFILCFIIFCFSCEKNDLPQEDGLQNTTEDIVSPGDETAGDDDPDDNDSANDDSADDETAGGDNSAEDGSDDDYGEEENSYAGYNEFFTATVDGEEFVVTANDQMLAEIRSTTSTPTELTIYGAGETGEIFVHFKVDGTGTFNTGIHEDRGYGGYAYYYNYVSNYIWLNDRGIGDPGVIEITLLNSEVVEGSFEIRVHDPNLPDPMKELTGKFGLSFD